MNNMTALVSAFARAYHNEKYMVPIFSDSIAKQLLGQDYEKVAESMKQGISFFAPTFHGSEEEALRYIVDQQLSPLPLARSAFAEQALQRAVNCGTKQYLLLGAGYDTFAHRQPDWAERLQIFELDKEEMSRDKQERIGAALLPGQENLHYAAADLSQENWQECLMRKGFSTEKISFCSLLGLIYYLPKDAFKALMKKLSQILPTGSSLVFDYPMTVEGEQSKKQKLLAQGAEEPMQAEYDYEELEQLLSSCGFRIYEHLLPDEMTEQYFSLHNLANPEHPMKAMEAAAYCLAVRK